MSEETGGKRHVYLPLVYDEAIDPQEPMVKIVIRDEDIPTWCLELALLQVGLADTLLIHGQPPTGAITEVELEVDRSRGKGVARVKWHPRRVALWISQREQTAWLAFFLYWYQHGAARVSHLDLGVRPQGGERGLSLVLWAAHAEPGITPEEFKRLLRKS